MTTSQIRISKLAHIMLIKQRKYGPYGRLKVFKDRCDLEYIVAAGRAHVIKRLRHEQNSTQCK